MICCKIVADYEDPQGSLSKLFDNLANHGTFLLENNNLFFSNTDDINFTQKKVENILKRSGYKNFLILVYDKKHDPKENEYINGWIIDKLIKINYNTYENQSQELFRNISHGLDMLDDELSEIEKGLERDDEALSGEGQDSGTG